MTQAPGIDPEERKDPQAALNGAQVQALVDIVQSVAAGAIPRDSGVAIIQAGFPLDQAQAEEVMGSVGRGFTPKPPEPDDGGSRGPP